MPLSDPQKQDPLYLLKVNISEPSGTPWSVPITGQEVYSELLALEPLLDKPVGVVLVNNFKSFLVELEDPQQSQQLTHSLSMVTEWQGCPAKVGIRTAGDDDKKFYLQVKQQIIIDRAFILPGASWYRDPQYHSTPIRQGMVDKLMANLESLSDENIANLLKLAKSEKSSRVRQGQGGDVFDEEEGGVNQTLKFFKEVFDGKGSIKTGSPRFGTFSGDPQLKNSEVSYEQWEFEVLNALDRWTPEIVKEALIKSVKGVAADTIRYLGPEAEIDEILTRMQVKYGTVASYDTLMCQFYAQVQKEDETIEQFSTRIEKHLGRILRKYPEKMDEQQREVSLKDRLFHGAHKTIRDSVRHKFDNPQTDYTELITVTRKAEEELPQPKDKKDKNDKGGKKDDKKTSDKTEVKSKSVNVTQEEVEKLKEQIHSMGALLNNNQGQGNQGGSPSYPPPGYTGNYRGKNFNPNHRGRGGRGNGGPQNQNQGQNQNQNNQGGGWNQRGRGWRRGGNRGGWGQGPGFVPTLPFQYQVPAMQPIVQGQQQQPQVQGQNQAQEQGQQPQQQQQQQGQQPQFNMANVQCYNCQGFGHMSRACPSLNQHGLAQGGV